MKRFKFTVIDDNDKILSFIVDCDNDYFITSRLRGCLVSVKEVKNVK